LFFGGMALLVAAVVVVGFSHSYFAAGMLRAPLPNLLVHVHAAAMTLWMILFLTQTALVSARRVAWHRSLGLVAFCLPLLMVPLALGTALDELRRETASSLQANMVSVPHDSAAFLAESILGIAAFAVLILASWRTRRRPDAHKRLALYATISLSSGALIRFPWARMGLNPMANLAALALLLALVIGYDLFALHRIHRASLWAAPLAFAASALVEPLAATAIWQRTAEFLARYVAPHI
jgi:hypothetical protein